jgi:hypothetical protein
MTLKLGKSTRMWAITRDSQVVMDVAGPYLHRTKIEAAYHAGGETIERVLVTVERIPKKGGKR